MFGPPRLSVCLPILGPHTHTLSSKRVPPWHQRGEHTHLGVKWLGSQFRQLERKTRTLSTLWTGGSVRQLSPSANRQ
jgi:hypothetical protein